MPNNKQTFLAMLRTELEGRQLQDFDYFFPSVTSHPTREAFMRTLRRSIGEEHHAGFDRFFPAYAPR